MPHTRARIRFDSTKQINDFVRQLNSDGTTQKFTLESFDCQYRADARSYLGVIYASAEFGDEMYLVNETKDGEFPSFVDSYRV